MAWQVGETGQSPGMRVVGLKCVQNQTGQVLGFGMGVVRGLANIINSIICYIGWLFPLWDNQRQTVADKIMSTYVVTVPKQPFSLLPAFVGRHRGCAHGRPLRVRSQPSARSRGWRCSSAAPRPRICPRPGVCPARCAPRRACPARFAAPPRRCVMRSVGTSARPSRPPRSAWPSSSWPCSACSGSGPSAYAYPWSRSAPCSAPSGCSSSIASTCSSERSPRRRPAPEPGTDGQPDEDHERQHEQRGVRTESRVAERHRVDARSDHDADQGGRHHDGGGRVPVDRGRPAGVVGRAQHHGGPSPGGDDGLRLSVRHVGRLVHDVSGRPEQRGRVGRGRGGGLGPVEGDRRGRGPR